MAASKRIFLSNSLVLFFATFSALSLAVQWAHKADAQDNEPAETRRYKVPNPFQDVPASKRNDYYMIRSSQTTFSTHRHVAKLEVEEYFSLGRALTFSIHRPVAASVSGESSKSQRGAWALIGDGRYGRWYVVRNFDDATSEQDLECELDQAHSHRQVFPWQYVYDIGGGGGDGDTGAQESSQSQSQSASELNDIFPGLLPEPTTKSKRNKNNKRGKKGKKGPRKAFIYGVGAIWLNAIKSDTRSDLVGDHSPYQLSNSWVLETERIRVELLFDKLAKETDGDAVEIQRLLDAQPLANVKINRKHMLDGATKAGRASGGGGSATTTSVDEQSEYVVVEEFKSDMSEVKNSAEMLEKLAFQLDFCRRANKQHRLFPSLLRALSSAPQQLYELTYIAQYFELFSESGGVRHDGRYDEARHRYLRANELTREVFSMKARSELVVYEALTEREPAHERMDVFMAKFGERKAARSTRATRHSTNYYHLILMEDSETCEVGKREPSSKYGLLQRPFTFHAGGQDLLAHIRGLGALLMNAADMPYKSFSLASRKIELAQNPNDLEEKRTVEVEEWQVEDKRSNWRVHFFIEVRNRVLEPVSWDLTERARADLARLVRIDIRETRATEDDLSPDDLYVIQQDMPSENQNDDSDLLVRYTIVAVNFELPADEEEIATTTPDICKSAADSNPSGKGEDADSSEDDDADADESEREDYFKYDQNYDEDESSNSGNGRDKDDDDDEDRGERSEFEPGQLEEDYPLPDFVDFLEDESRYSFETKLELIDGDEDPGDLDDDDDGGDDDDDEVANPDAKSRKDEQPKRRRIWLREQVDLRDEKATISVFESDKALKSDEFVEKYLVLYEAEIMFRLVSGNGKCQHIEELDDSNKWLRLFSDQWVYHTVPAIMGHNLTNENEDSGHGSELQSSMESSRYSLLGVGALWRRASESGRAEFLGKRRAIVERDNKRYKQLVWQVEELDMIVRFTFLMELKEEESSKDGDKKKKKKQQQQKEVAPENLLRLDSITFTNQLSDGRLADHFKQVRAKISKFSIGRPNDDTKDYPFELPLMCREQFMQAQLERRVEPAEVRPLSPVESNLGGGAHSPGHYLHYIVTHTASLNAADPKAGYKSATMQVAETFDRARNRAKIIVTFMRMTAEVYIEGASKQIFAYSEKLNQCAIIDTIEPVFKTLLNGLKYENENFDPERLYGLAGLWNDLSFRDAKMRTNFYLDLNGLKHEARVYNLAVTTSGASPPTNSSGGSGKWNDEQRAVDVQLTFRKERPYMANNFNHETKAKIRPEDNFTLRSIRLRPFEKRTHKERAGISRMHKSTLIYIDDQKPFDGRDEWPLPAICAHAKKAQGSSSSGGGGGGDGEAGDQSNQQTNDTTKPKPENVQSQEFPRASDLLARMNSFHMKSEITLSGQVNKVYVLDEWLHNGHLRMRARGLGQASKDNFDFLVYADTREQFDLSKPFRCPANHFPADSFGQSSSASKQLELLLNDNTAELDRPASLYFGPLALWRLAERHLANAKLVRSIEISLEHLESAETFMKQLERELSREVWQFSVPDESRLKWTFTMEFLKLRSRKQTGDNEQETAREWHVLQNIQSDDLEGTTVLIDVANYKYEPKPEDMLELFRLPEGWGCRRDLKVFESFHDFSLDWHSNWYLSYEASLELLDAEKSLVIDDSELGTLKLSPQGGTGATLPTLSGSFARSYSGAQRTNNTFVNADLSVHLRQTRFPNGRSELKRLVFDGAGPTEYALDETTGACDAPSRVSGGWQLVFPQSKRPFPHLVRLLNPFNGVAAESSGGGTSGADLAGSAQSMEPLLKQLFLNTIDADHGDNPKLSFAPLNKFSGDSNRVVYTSYEREFDSLKLTDDLSGPARVVRKFEHVRGQSNDWLSIALHGRTLKLDDGRERVVTDHTQVSTRVFLLTEDKLRVRAILDMSLRKHPTLSLSDFLASAAGVSECFTTNTWSNKQQVAHYTLEYPMRDLAMRLIARYYSAPLIESLYASLLQTARLLPLQLDGAARVDLTTRGDDLLRIHFSVMEAPSSYLYFRRRAQCAMSERVEAVSEFRLAANLIECSRWCDRINCLAMSYCEDHSCRVATSRALFGSGERGGGGGGGIGSSGEPIDLSDSYQLQPACAYYYNRERTRTRTLSSFKDYMDRIVNIKVESDKLKLFALAFDIYDHIEPTRFYEESSDSEFRWQHEGDKDDEQTGTAPLLVELPPADSSSTTNVKHANYARLRSGQVLEISNLDTDELSSFHWFSMHAHSTAECFEMCDRTPDCFLVSHCKNNLECRGIMTSDLGAISDHLNDLKREVFVPGGSDCAILMRDYLAEYETYDKTQVPSSFSRQLDEYSALECAVACQAANGSDACLSFDLCTFTNFDQPRQVNGKVESGKESTCFLQASHVTLDSFDRTVLLPAWDSDDKKRANKISGRPVTCEHYSKSLLMSFARLPNKRRLKVAGAPSIKGISAERCAADCLCDDKCHAFEYCLNERRWPMQSCYLIRSNDFVVAVDGDNASSLESSTPNVSVESIRALLKDSNVCSVYLTKSLAFKERLNRTLAYDVDELNSANSESSSYGTFLVIVLILAAILLGATIQFAHIKLTGRPLLVR